MNEAGMATKTSSLAAEFSKVLRSFETGGFTHQLPHRIDVQADYIYSRAYDVIVQRNVNLAQVKGQFVSVDPRFSARPSAYLQGRTGQAACLALHAGRRREEAQPARQRAL